MPGVANPARYTTTASLLHWLIAVLVLGMIALGWWMQEIPKVPAGPRVNAYNLHKSIGLAVLLLMLGRVLWRTTHPPPVLPAMPRWQAQLARGVHLLLYVCLLVQPLTGYVRGGVTVLGASGVPLTATPGQGPSVVATANSAGASVSTSVAHCELVTLYGPGLGPQLPVPANAIAAWPSLARSPFTTYLTRQ